MTDSELGNLVRMANQIAANFSFHEDAEDRILDHLVRFWAPSMRQALLAHARAGGDGLDPTAAAAALRLETA